MTYMKRHNFIICAYKESPYLEKCIKSILNQEYLDESEILICTSTPNDYIKGMAEKYGIKLVVNPDRGDIQSDWNFAYNFSDAQYITLVHQDDVYNKAYSRHLIDAVNKYQDIAIYYTKYRALTTTEKEERVERDINCRLRSFLSFPMSIPALQTSGWWKRLTLRFGNSICCSSVTYNKNLLGNVNLFHSDLRFSLDWDTYWELTDVKGRFFFDKSPLTYFRIHQLSTTMLCIEDDSREKEDYIMFYKMWPWCIANFIMHFYKLAYCNYQSLDKKGKQK